MMTFLLFEERRPSEGILKAMPHPPEHWLPGNKLPPYTVQTSSNDVVQESDLYST